MRGTTIHRHGNERGDRGASAVEFALVFFLLIIIVTGIIQFGWTFYQYLQVEHAAREGARWASLRADVNTIRAKTAAAAPGLPGLDPNRVTVRVEGVVRAAGSGITVADASKAVSVTVTYDSPILGPFVDLISSSRTRFLLTGVAEMRVE